jgi:hypothetical protein
MCAKMAEMHVFPRARLMYADLHKVSGYNWSLIPVTELDGIANARLEDGKALLAAGRCDGAAYICEYAVEVGLKARICRTLNWSEFPSTGGEFQAYRT